MTRLYKIYLLIMVMALIIVLVIRKERSVEPSDNKEFSKNPYSLYLAGSYAKKINDFDKASYYFNKLESEHKDDDTKDLIDKNLYVIALIKGDFEKAKEIVPSKDNTSYFINIVNMVKVNDYKSAQLELNKIKSSKEEVLKYLLNAWFYAGQNKKAEAYKEISKVKAKGITNLDLLNKFYLAIHFQDEKMISEILPKLQKENLTVRSVYLIVEYYCEQGKFEEAQKVVNEKLKDDSMIEILSNYIVNYKPTEKKLFTNVNSGISEVFSNFGMLIFNPNSWELSVYFAQLSLSLVPTHEFSKILLAEIFEARKLTDNANELYKTIDKTSYLYPSAQLKIANNIYASGEKDKSIGMLNSLTKSYPNYSTAYIYLAEKYIKDQEYKKALSTLTKVEKSIKDKKDKHWNIYYYIALCNDKLGKLEGVEDNLATALVLSPGNPIVMNYLGYFWIEQNKNQENAIKLIEQAVISNPLDVNYIDSFAWALYKTGKIKEGLRLLELCVQRSASNPSIRIHLGQVYFEQGRLKEAKYQWENASLFKSELSPLEQKDLENKLKSVK